MDGKKVKLAFDVEIVIKVYYQTLVDPNTFYGQKV